VISPANTADDALTELKKKTELKGLARHGAKDSKDADVSRRLRYLNSAAAFLMQLSSK
jgi:hypothetical protein